MWRQSRPSLDINTTISLLILNRCAFAARVLKEVGPQTGPHITNARPGESYHQYGLALDVYRTDAMEMKAVWTPEAYAGLIGKAHEFKLESGADFANLRGDVYHLQVPVAETPMPKGLRLNAILDRSQELTWGTDESTCYEHAIERLAEWGWSGEVDDSHPSS